MRALSRPSRWFRHAVLGLGAATILVVNIRDIGNLFYDLVWINGMIKWRVDATTELSFVPKCKMRFLIGKVLK
jgi:hypothetical protein